jgi:Helicase associated domain
VPQRHKTEEGYRLGQWVNVQRANKKGLDPSRWQRLEALSGWDWNPGATQWEEGFSKLKHFSEREGHCVVTRDHKTEDGYRLGAWVSSQRKNRGFIHPDRRQRLEALVGWSWEPHSDLWEMGFSKLKHFSEREGHCRVSRTYKTDDGYRLGQWVKVQRTNKNGMAPSRHHRLDALPGVPSLGW